MKIPWKITQPLSQIPNLFQNENLSYQADGYFCSCGKTTIFIKDLLDDNHVVFECDECGNKEFYYTSIFENKNLGYDYYYENNFIAISKDFFGENLYIPIYDDEEETKKNIHDYPFEFKTILDTNEKRASIAYGFEMPYQINLLKNEIEQKFFVLLSFELDFITLQYSEQHAIDISEISKKEFESKLLQQIKLDKPIDIPFENQIRTLEQLIFFLHNKHLLDFEFWYWDKYLIEQLPNDDLTITAAIKILAGENRSKSVLKAIYENYAIQMAQTKRYHALLFIPFLKTITDPNILVKLLHLKIPLFEADLIQFESFLEFLKEHYTQIQIYNFFQKIDFTNNDDEILFNDMFHLFNDLMINRTFFIKVKCTLIDLHNEFISATQMIYDKFIVNKKLNYLKSQRRRCGLIKGYKVNLPSNGTKLILWSRTLNNCLSGYFYRLLERKTIVYGFFENKKLLFAVELQNDKIVQAKQKFNQPLNQMQQKILDDWYKLHFLRE